MELIVEPALPGTDIEERLFERIKADPGERGVSIILTRVDSKYDSKVRQLERLGFVKSEYQNHGMERNLGGVNQAAPPVGYKLRVARKPDELEIMLPFSNKAFATREKNVPISMERLRRIISI